MRQIRVTRQQKVAIFPNSPTSATALSCDTVDLVESKAHTVVERGGDRGETEIIYVESGSGLRNGAVDPSHLEAKAMGY